MLQPGEQSSSSPPPASLPLPPSPLSHKMLPPPSPSSPPHPNILPPPSLSLPLRPHHNMLPPPSPPLPPSPPHHEMVPPPSQPEAPFQKQHKPLFLNIAAELRNRVYALALTLDGEIGFRHCRDWGSGKLSIKRDGIVPWPHPWPQSHRSACKDDPTNQIDLRKLAVGLLAVCRQINFEAAPVLYGANKFAFYGASIASHTIGSFGGNFVHLRKLKLGNVKNTISGEYWRLNPEDPWYRKRLNEFVELMSTLDRKEKGEVLELTLGFNSYSRGCELDSSPYYGEDDPCPKMEVRFLKAVLPFMGQSHYFGEGKDSKGRLQIELFGEGGLIGCFQQKSRMKRWASASGIILRKIRGYMEEDPSLATVPLKSRYIGDCFPYDWKE